jgi:hypothetical protein
MSGEAGTCTRCGAATRPDRPDAKLCVECDLKKIAPEAMKFWGDIFGPQFAGIFGPESDDHDVVDMDDDDLYAACRTGGSRATKREMAARREAVYRITGEVQPCSVRQVFYQATVHGIVEKSEAGYEKVQRMLVELRRAKKIPYGWISDNTRWQIKPTTYDSITDALESTAAVYRRAVWSDVDAYVEVWLEKDALSGVVNRMTSKYDVPLMVARGFSSLTFLHSSAEYINEIGKPVFIYHLGDDDPSGVLAGKKIEQTLRELAPDAEIHFKRIAVTVDQIAKWQLPSRPTKDSTHAKGWRRDSVELDAIHPDNLRGLVEDAILRHLPKHQMDVLKVAEDSEREMLQMFAKKAAA